MQIFCSIFFLTRKRNSPHTLVRVAIVASDYLFPFFHSLMALLELVSVLTHIPLFLVFRNVVRRLYCTTLLLLNVMVMFMASLSYHLCKLINDSPCFWPIAVEQLNDHAAAENVIVSVAFYYAPFRREWHRVVMNLLATAGLIVYKIQTDTLYYTFIVSVVVISTGVRYYWRYREFQMALAWGFVGGFFYFIEGTEENAINVFYHSGWHICIFMSLNYAIAARRYRPDSEDCKCKIPVKSGIKVDENPTSQYQPAVLFPAFNDHYIAPDGSSTSSSLPRYYSDSDHSRTDSSSSSSPSVAREQDHLVTINGRLVRYVHDPAFGNQFGNFTSRVEIQYPKGLVQYRLNMVAS